MKERRKSFPRSKFERNGRAWTIVTSHFPRLFTGSISITYLRYARALCIRAKPDARTSLFSLSFFCSFDSCIRPSLFALCAVYKNIWTIGKLLSSAWNILIFHERYNDTINMIMLVKFGIKVYERNYKIFIANIHHLSEIRSSSFQIKSIIIQFQCLETLIS